MSAFGMTYAVYVAIVGGSLIAFDPPPEEATAQPAAPAWLYSLGRNDPVKMTPGADGFLSLEYRPNEDIRWGFKPTYALGLSVDGAAYVSAGIRKDFRVGPLQVTPYFGPAVYQKQLGSEFTPKGLVQFRTGFDVFVPVTPKVSVGLGYYHMSNANMSDESAGLDVTRLTVQYRY